MDFLELLRTRRSTRQFLPKKIENEKVNQLIQAALLSPSGKNRRPWQFIVVEETETLEKLAEAKPHGAKLIAGAPLAIVVVGEPQNSDIWIEDVSIASVLIQLAAEDLDLGSCWVQIRNRSYQENKSSETYIKELLNIPEESAVESVIAIGYKAKERAPYELEELPYEKISREKYGEPLK